MIYLDFYILFSYNNIKNMATVKVVNNKLGFIYFLFFSLYFRF